MPNREHLLNLSNQIAELLLELPHIADAPDVIRDAQHLLDALESARAEQDALHIPTLEEAAHVKPLHDRLHAAVIHCRVMRNNLDRIEHATGQALELSRQMSAAVEEPEQDDGDL